MKSKPYGLKVLEKLEKHHKAMIAKLAKSLAYIRKLKKQHYSKTEKQK